MVAVALLLYVVVGLVAFTVVDLPPMGCYTRCLCTFMVMPSPFLDYLVVTGLIVDLRCYDGVGYGLTFLWITLGCCLDWFRFTGLVGLYGSCAPPHITVVVVVTRLHCLRCYLLRCYVVGNLPVTRWPSWTVITVGWFVRDLHLHSPHDTAVVGLTLLLLPVGLLDCPLLITADCSSFGSVVVGYALITLALVGASCYLHTFTLPQRWLVTLHCTTLVTLLAFQLRLRCSLLCQLVVIPPIATVVDCLLVVVGLPCIVVTLLDDCVGYIAF